jgi:sterol 3beta-glucosyltransferase
MRITILTAGSRGDVQPYMALGSALQRAGHTVTLSALGIFERWIREAGLGFASVPDFREFFQLREVQQTHLEFIQNPLKFPAKFLGIIRQARSLFTDMFTDLWQACQEAEFIIASFMTFAGIDCAAKLNRPACLAFLQPLTPTVDFPMFFLPPGLTLGGRYNRLTHILTEKIAWWFVLRSIYNPWRQKTLGFPPLSEYPLASFRKARVPTLYAYSPVVLSKPRDWPAWCHVTGYWFLNKPEGFRPTPALLRFLEAGPPPIYIGFGSMTTEEPQRLTKIALSALQMTDQRGILLSGWAGLSSTQLPQSVFCLDDIPHDWLFPQMAAVVHHGGAGTTGASLRAGIPTILTPFMFDQFGWGRILPHLGVGPKSIPAQELTAEKLAAAIQMAVMDKTIHERAAEIGRSIRSEDGAARAIEILQKYL